MRTFLYIALGVLVVLASFALPTWLFLTILSDAPLWLPLSLGCSLGITFAIFGAVLTRGAYDRWTAYKRGPVQCDAAGDAGAAAAAVAASTAAIL